MGLTLVPPAEASDAPIMTTKPSPTKLAPERATSLMMGVWFLASAVGNYLGGRAASLYETLELPTLFGIVGAIPIAAGLVLLLLVPAIRKLMAGVH